MAMRIDLYRVDAATDAAVVYAFVRSARTRAEASRLCLAHGWSVFETVSDMPPARTITIPRRPVDPTCANCAGQTYCTQPGGC